MPNYYWTCESCGDEEMVMAKIADMDTPPEPCMCGKSAWTRPIRTPAVLNHIFISKQHRENMDPGFADLKAASKIEKKMLNKPPAERREMQKEINRLKRSKKT